MDQLDIAYLSGTEALARFAARTLSPVELLDAVIARAEGVELRVNAIADRFYAEARAAALKAEAAWGGKGPAPRPLEGLNLAVKEADHLAGTRNSNGSLLHMDRVDTTTAPVVQRLLDAGAIPHMKTTVPEFCILGATHSRAFGITRNPWNLAFGPGGSSGGSGVVLATGGATLATGSDIGGSIRIPASACGVVGYKAPYGRNPGPAAASIDSYAHFGVMARSVADVALMQNQVSGRHPEDIVSLAESMVVPTAAPPSLKGRRIAWSMDLGAFEVDAGVVAATRQALAVLESLGAQLEEVDLGWDARIIRAAQAYFAHGWGNTMTANFARDRALMTEYAIDFVEGAAKATVENYHFARAVEVEMYASFGPLMERFDAFICPTTSVPSVPADFIPGRTPVVINGCEKIISDDEWAMTTPFNMLSRCPVLAVPSGIHSNGVPTGIQIVGRAYDDIAVFEIGLAFEQAAPWLGTGSRPRLG